MNGAQEFHDGLPQNPVPVASLLLACGTILLAGILMHFGPPVLAVPGSRSFLQFAPVFVGAVWLIPTGFKMMNGVMSELESSPPPRLSVLCVGIAIAVTCLILVYWGLADISNPNAESVAGYVLLILGGLATIKFSLNTSSLFKRAIFEENYISSLNSDDFFKAAIKGNVDMLRRLLANGHGINRKDTKGWTALLHTTYHNHKEAANFLIDQGAALDEKTDEGQTALMHSVLTRNIELLEYLVKKGATVNVKDNEGTSALMIASVLGPLESVKILLNKEAKVNEKNNNGLTALMYAIPNENIAIVRELIDHGADVNIKNNNGDTAIDGAKEKGDSELISLLKNAGNVQKD